MVFESFAPGAIGGGDEESVSRRLAYGGLSDASASRRKNSIR